MSAMEETIRENGRDADNPLSLDPEESEQSLEENASESEGKAEALEYDSESQQRIPVLLPIDDEQYEVTLVQEPMGDGLLREYARQVARAMDMSVDDEADTSTSQVGTALDAVVVLFDRLMSDLEGIGEEGEEKPSDWRDIFSAQDKASIINSAVFGVTVVEPKTSKKKRPSWKGQLKHITTRLRVPFGGHMLETSHTLRKSDAKLFSEFVALTGGYSIRGSDAHMPKLGSWYDTLHVSHTGYKNNVPLHHKAIALSAHLTRQGRAVRKNG